MTTLLYRYVDCNAFHGDGFEIRRYKVLRETPRGYWFIPLWAKNYPEEFKETHKRWVSNDGRRRYCYPTKVEAWNSYYIRKHRHLARLKEDIKRIQAIVNVMQHQQYPPSKDCVVCRELSRGLLFDD